MPRLRWLEDVENDLRELKLKKENGRRERVSVLNEAKILSEP
jgi:hypothetical protein